MRLFIDTPIGILGLTADDKALTGVSFGGGETGFQRSQELSGGAGEILREARRQLTDYFAGERREFDFHRLPLRLSGTDFTQKVGRALLEIPYGEVRTYGEIAAAVDSPRAARAVGGACHRNPVCIIVPCHRVVGIGNRLTGFGGGMGVKAWLLAHEGVHGIR